ncbi:hypothetical protein CEXT_124571 [Caerostris extrusa]|uniref:Uncharacterized protein n=1 Tax=Caerostris extrusa TaxID=172846 RepID=A0AAV4XJR5_CAEEX|nr:hypothetical protein CEXT_124571 [Caerostris extrusa]
MLHKKKGDFSPKSMATHFIHLRNQQKNLKNRLNLSNVAPCMKFQIDRLLPLQMLFYKTLKYGVSEDHFFDRLERNSKRAKNVFERDCRGVRRKEGKATSHS